MATTAAHEPIVGRIEYNLHLSHQSSEFVKKRKRTSLSIRDEGIFFVPSNADQIYLVIAPQRLLKRVCDAARHSIEVTLTHYSILSLISDSKSDDSDDISNVALIKVAELELQQEPPLTQWETAVSLREFHVAEREHCKVNSLSATVSSISPIIAVAPSDPFCLMEIVQEVENETSCVCLVVIKGNSALVCQAAIQPGDEILLRDFVRQQWTVPKSMIEKGFWHMHVPRRVLVITDPNSIQWRPEVGASTSLESPITMVEGSIFDIVCSNDCMAGVVLENEGKRTMLFLSQYPMSTNTQLSLQRGTILRAINVHLLPFTCPEFHLYYGACLRATISIVRPASLGVRKRSANPDSGCVDTALSISSPIIPWKYSRIRSSYFQQALQSHLQRSEVKIPVADLFGAITSLYRLGAAGETLETLVHVNDAVGKASKRRDQFAEFFDHACNNNLDCSVARGCHLSSSSQSVVEFPAVLKISILRQHLFQHLESTVRQWAAGKVEKKINAGTVASIQIPNSTIAGKVRRGCTSTLLHVAGSLTSAGANSYASLGDSRCSVPITVEEDKEVRSFLSNVTVVCNVKGCIATVMCLGATPKVVTSDVRSQGNGGNSASPILKLPNWSELSTSSNQSRTGSSALMICEGNIFMLSVHVHCDEMLSVKDCVATTPKAAIHRRETVHGMVCPQQAVDTDCFTGLLCRQRMKVNKIKGGKYNGLVLTLSHSPSNSVNEMSSDDVSQLQTVELKVSISISQHTKSVFFQLIRKLPALSGASLLDEQCDLALAWWRLSDASSSSSIIAGGLDESLKNHQEVAIDRFVPRLVVPVSVLEKGTNGFVRFKCSIDELQVSLVKVSEIPMKNVAGSGSVWNSIGGQRFLPGMLDRIALREGSGVPDCTLGDIHRAICADMRHRTQSCLAPNMLRKVPRAKLLGINYCRAQIQCSRCFKSLTSASKGEPFASGVVDHVEMNFWNTPMPLNGKVEVKPAGMKLRNLHCPNHCPAECGEVKWECSGILDDGSGQAKLYSERDASLKFLGLCPETIQAVEAGAWETADGVIFQGAMPPSSFVKGAIREARAIAVQSKRKNVKEEDVLRLLTPIARAIYMLHRHCSSARTSERDYFVRCKPLSTEAVHLNRSQIHTTISAPGVNQQALTTDSVSYSLPPLKLVLVDCVPSGELGA